MVRQKAEWLQVLSSVDHLQRFRQPRTSHKTIAISGDLHPLHGTTHTVVRGLINSPFSPPPLLGRRCFCHLMAKEGRKDADAMINVQSESEGTRATAIIAAATAPITATTTINSDGNESSSLPAVTPRCPPLPLDLSKPEGGERHNTCSPCVSIRPTEMTPLALLPTHFRWDGTFRGIPTPAELGKIIAHRSLTLPELTRLAKSLFPITPPDSSTFSPSYPKRFHLPIRMRRICGKQQQPVVTDSLSPCSSSSLKRSGERFYCQYCDMQRGEGDGGRQEVSLHSPLACHIRGCACGCADSRLRRGGGGTRVIPPPSPIICVTWMLVCEEWGLGGG
ncbi:hypothetical protein TcWFU_007499 [Taenia crassiceps]|uniref:Uncharacterized protein n=1 Tax=Taenia crassiceps TaxID=6207 RepID=A0ABR4QST4_9CEST